MCHISYESANVLLISPEMYYYPLYSGWTFPEYPFLFCKPTEATCWAMSRFKRDGLGSLWEPLDYPVFLKFVGRVTISNSDIVRVSSPTLFNFIYPKMIILFLIQITYKYVLKRSINA